MTESILATAFLEHQRLAAGPLPEVALAARAALARDATATILVFADATGRVIDLDLRGSEAELRARYAPQARSEAPRPGRGRPSLGVTAREVTLLPGQWDWLAQQSRNVSATLRRMIEDARRSEAACPPRRQQRDVAYRVATALAGDLPGYEEAMRALFADRAGDFAHHAAAWPTDIRAYVTRLAFPEAKPGAAAFLAPSAAAAVDFRRRYADGPVVLLNLLRFRAEADYSAAPALAPPAPISGRDAFDRYIRETRPLLEASGGELLFLGDAGPFVIGPPEEQWDCAMLVRQVSATRFLAFAEDARFQHALAHRTAALRDSRLLPLQERAR